MSAMAGLNAAAQSGADGQAGDAPHVQLPSFMAPIVRTDGKRGTAALTLVLEVRTPEEVRKLCAMSPRIRDAVVQNLYAHPLRKLDNRELDLDGVGERLAVAANAALDQPFVVDVSVFEGMRTAGGGKAAKFQVCK